MVSPLHEGVISLVRDRPAFVADLLARLDVDVPHFTEARLADATLSNLAPVEYHADAVILLHEEQESVLGAVVEVQRAADPRKLFTWPAYATSARAKHRCPFIVLVVSPDARTARWAALPIPLGGGNWYRPLVVGPEDMPKITDGAEAQREPHLAMLSVIAHGRGEPQTAATIGAAATRALSSFPEEQRLVYSLLIQASLSEAARKVFEMRYELPRYFNEAQRENYERGEARGEAKALLRILAQRGLTVTEEQQRSILACTDLATVENWLDRSFSVSTVAELLASTT